MRFSVLGLAAAACMASSQAHCQLATIDVASIQQAVKSYAVQAQQLQQQAQAYATQLRQYALLVQNTVALPTQVWNTVQGDIMQVRALSNAASLLSGNSGSMIQRLSSAAGYANQAASLGNMAGQLTMWQQTIGNNIDTMGRTLGLQQSQQQNNAALIEAMQAHSSSATGQLQAIQAGNELASATANQLIQIQATLAATAQMNAGIAAVAADRAASQDAAMQAFAGALPTPVVGRQW